MKKDNSFLPHQDLSKNYFTRESAQFPTKLNWQQNGVKCILQHVLAK